MAPVQVIAAVTINIPANEGHSLQQRGLSCAWPGTTIWRRGENRKVLQLRLQDQV